MSILYPVLSSAYNITIGAATVAEDIFMSTTTKVSALWFRASTTNGIIQARIFNKSTKALIASSNGVTIPTTYGNWMQIPISATLEANVVYRISFENVGDSQNFFFVGTCNAPTPTVNGISMTLTDKYTNPQGYQTYIYGGNGGNVFPENNTQISAADSSIDFKLETNTAPTTPSSITVPTTSQKAGTSVAVSWGASTDAEGNTRTYYLEFYNGSAWVACGSTAALTLDYTLPSVNISNAQFRVRCYDGALYSAYTTSSAFSIYTNTASIISGNANEDLGNKNTPFSIIYQVNDVDSSNVLSIVEKLNGNQINSISNAPRNTDFVINITRAILDTLPLNTPSTVQISVNDGTSTTYKTVTFTRTNSGPQITNSDSDLGIVSNVTQKYTCHDVEGNSFTIVEKVDNVVLKSFAGVDGTEYTTDIPYVTWFELTNGTHTYTITATDSLGTSTVRTFTFTKNETVIESTGLTNIIQTDAAATKILLTPNWNGKENADVILFQVCNNAFDVSPTWEDATSQTLLGKTYVFTNTVKTATNWGIDIKFKITRKAGTTASIDFYGLGGAFE